jgi:putative hemolysin
MTTDPFALPRPRTPILGRIAALTQARLSHVAGLSELERIYRAVLGPESSRTPADAATVRRSQTDGFIEQVLAALDVTVEVSDLDVARVPVSGPLLVAANHPRGALDGLVVASLLRRVRSDVRIIVNHVLSRIPELHDHAFFVDPFGGPTAESRSRAGLRAAHLWLRRGGAVVMFPAGEVAHQLSDGVPVESPWHATMGRLALQTGAAILPLGLVGRNSAWFYGAGRIHPLLRTALLPRELLRARGARVRVAIGVPMVPGRFDVPLATQETGPMAGRTCTEHAFGNRDAYARHITDVTRAGVCEMTAPGASQARPAHDRLRAEVAALDPGARLVSSGAFRVLCAPADQIPCTLREIGRLRADTYRAAGEGTTAECDLDRFDTTYQHLFVWDDDKGAVVGAYRLGRTDRLVEAGGVTALYTRTLFDFDEQLLAQLPPAIELGRSFVRAEYQRQHQPLALLWKGIGQFVSRHPQYRVLFGPVSVSARYRDVSHGFLVSFLERNRLDRRLAGCVSPRHPFVGTRPVNGVTSLDADALEQTIASLEPDGKGVPVLLRQYLRLGARALGFGMDPDFGGVLDALMMVDLVDVDRGFLARYLGREQAAAYLAKHRRAPSVAA